MQTGTGSTVLSRMDTVYAPCACGPICKMSKQSQPYKPGDPEVYTTYTYDALGRTVRVLLADGASHTTYTYQGNFTTVTDPAGKWKQYANDAFGNLVTVLEPDPMANPVPGAPATPPAYPVSSAPARMLLTSHNYDQVNHLATTVVNGTTIHAVRMPRGEVTQTRDFVYTPTTYATLVLPALWLTSVTNPENGTVSYTYNADGTLASRGAVGYTYDVLGYQAQYLV